MTIEQAVATILVALIVNLPSYFLSRETNRKLRAEREALARESQAKAAAEQTRREQLEQEITERVLASSSTELDRQQKRIDAQQAVIAEHQKQIGAMSTKLIEKDAEMVNMRRGFQEQIDKLAEVVRQLIRQIELIGHAPDIDLDEFKSIEAKYR